MRYSKKLLAGQTECSNGVKGYNQKVVLIDKSNLDTWSINSFSKDPTAGSSPFYGHSITFKLKPSKRGLDFENKGQTNLINGSYTSTIKDGIPRYKHMVTMPLFGLTAKTKMMLHSLNWSDYFAVLRHNSGAVEVYGFELGLEPNSFTMDGNDNGGVLTLQSIEDEFLPPINQLTFTLSEIDYSFQHAYDRDLIDTQDFGEFDDSFDDSFNVIND